MAWTVKKLAEDWGVSPKHIYRLIKAGRLRAFSAGTRKGIRITDEEKARWEEGGQDTLAATTTSDNETAKPSLSGPAMKALAAV